MIKLITQLHLAVSPLLLTSVAYAKMNNDQPTAISAIDPNTTSNSYPKACKIIVLNPTSNNTCQYSDKIEDLCNLTEQSPASQDSEHLTIRIPYNDECHFLLDLLENELEGFDTSSPDGPSTNATYIQITITKIPHSEIVKITLLLVLGAILGFLMSGKSSDFFAVGNETLRPPEPEQQSPPEPEQQGPLEPKPQGMPRQELELETPPN